MVWELNENKMSTRISKRLLKLDSFNFMELPLLCKQLIVNEHCAVREILMLEQVSKSVRSLIDWRQLARSAIRVLKDEHVPADNFVRTLEYDTFPKDSRIDEEDRLAGEQALRFVEAHRKELDERGEPKNAKAICCQISRYCLCIECERKCAMRWFGHRLHDRCREKNKEKYALLGHNEARSLPESKGFVVAPLYVFQMPSTNTMRLQMVWKRQYLVRLQRMRNEKIRNERAKASTSTSTSESSTQSRKKRKL